MYCVFLAGGCAISNPKSKFFLVKLIQKFDFKQPIRCTVKGFSRKLGVSTQLIKEVIPLLISKGYLTKEEVPQARGRPASQYQVELSALSYLQHYSSKEFVCEHKSLIDQLLMPDTSTKNCDKCHPLRLSTRLLLAVLISNADKCGVVRDLGFSDLSYLTGLSKDRLRSQLNKLKELGYIRQSVSGVIGSGLIGVAKSVYFMNISHTHFRSSAISGQITVFIGDVKEKGAEPTESQQLFKIVNEILSSEGWNEFNDPGHITLRRLPKKKAFVINCKGDFNKVLSFFKSSNLAEYLQLKMEEYASLLLSEQGHELLGVNFFQDENLIQKIRNEMLPLNVVLDEAAVSHQDSLDLVCGLLYYIAFNTAQSVLNVLVLYFNYPPTNMNHVLLPNAYHNKSQSSFTLLSYPKKGRVKNKSFIIKEEKKFLITGGKSHSEMDIKDDDRYKYGLLSRPDAKARTWEKSFLNK